MNQSSPGMGIVKCTAEYGRDFIASVLRINGVHSFVCSLELGAYLVP